MYDVRTKTRVLNGIRVYDFQPINATSKRLVFFQHGYTGNKEDGAWNQCLHFATRGIRAIAIDAYGHGERQTKPFIHDDYKREMDDFYVIIERTTNDIVAIYESYFKSEYPTYNMAGESMGGMISFMVPCISKECKGIASVVGSPSLVEYGYDDLRTNGIQEDQFQGMLDHLLYLDAMTHLETFKDIKIYMINGTRDTVVPKQYSIAFKKKMSVQFQKQDIVYKEVDTEHWVPHEHIISMYDWAKDHFQ